MPASPQLSFDCTFDSSAVPRASRILLEIGNNTKLFGQLLQEQHRISCRNLGSRAKTDIIDHIRRSADDRQGC